MGVKKSYKNSNEARDNRDAEYLQNESLRQKLAAKVAHYVFTKGGIEKAPKIWSYVSSEQHDSFKEQLITEILDLADWIEISAEYKKPDLNPILRNEGRIFKSKKTSSFWKLTSIEPRMGDYQSRLNQVNPQSGAILKSPENFRATLPKDENPEAENFKEFAQALEKLARDLMS